MSEGTPGGDQAAIEADALVLQNFHLADSSPHLLRRAHARAEGKFAARLAPFGLTPRQKALLITVYQNPGAALNEIAHYVALDRQTTADIAARLVKRGLLERKRSGSDRRAYALWVTESGEALLKQVIPVDYQVEEEVLSSVPPEYRQLLIKLLHVMTDNTDEER